MYKLPIRKTLGLLAALLVCGLPLSLAGQSTTQQFCDSQTAQIAILTPLLNQIASGIVAPAGKTQADEQAMLITAFSNLVGEKCVMMRLGDQIARLQSLIAPTTFGSTAIAGASDGSDTNIEFLTPFTTGLASSQVASCSLYAAAGSDPVNGKFGCTIRDANANLLCSTTSDATTATVPGWNSDATFANCPTLSPSTKYLFGFHKLPYGAVMAVENNNGPQSGFMAQQVNEPPYPQTLSNLQPSFQMSAYLTVAPIQ